MRWWLVEKYPTSELALARWWYEIDQVCLLI